MSKNNFLANCNREDVKRSRLNSYDNRNPFGLKYAVQFVTETPMPSRDWHNANTNEMDLVAGQVVKAREAWVKSVTDMRQANERSSSGQVLGRCLEVEVELPEGMTYETAGNLGIFPENDPESVDVMLSSLNLYGNEVFRLNRTDTPGSVKLPCPNPISVRDFLSRFIDLHGKLKPSVIKKLAKFATDPDTQAALNQLLEKGSRAMADFNTKKFGLVNIFQHYNISIKLDQLIEVSTRIPARYYTIASGSKASPSMIKICVSLTIEDMTANTFYGRISKNLSDMKARFDNVFY
jgi:sulfite reductase alpha subunit-like flavoprotein